MNLRERIADWISGGALSFWRFEAERWNAHWSGACERENGLGDEVTALRQDLERHQNMATVYLNQCMAYETTLRAIITEADRDQSRPSVKRIARIAKEALE